MNLTDTSLRNPVFAWMLMAVTILFGGLAASRIGISQYPDVDYPNISVSVSWSGASPSAVEREILEPLEQSLAQVEGVQQMTSTARSGQARISVTMDLSRDVDLALQDVQAKVAQAQRSLPKDVPAATVSKSNPDDTPILQVVVSGSFSRQILADVAQYQVQQNLQTVEGVGQITMQGQLTRNVRIWLDASRMAEKGVGASDILNAVTKDHVEIPGGAIDAGGRSLSVRMLGEALDLTEFKQLVVRRITETGDESSAMGSAGVTATTTTARTGTATAVTPVESVPVYLEDVAYIEDGFADETSISRLDGQPLQTLGVLKQRGANAVSVASAVREKVDEIQKTLPEGMVVEVLFDTTEFISESVHEVETELVLAILLTAVVCWLFLGSFSSTFNVVLAIPMSLLGTVAVIYFLGFTLNTFTLLALSLSVGLVVDDAIMILENIHRHAEMGKNVRQAAGDGTHEIKFAALAASVAVIAIFLPVIFIQGVIGKFFYQFGITLSIAVGISYLEAITLAPARCAQFLKISHDQGGRVRQGIERAWTALDRFYRRVLGLATAHPIKTQLLSLAVLGLAIVTYTRIPAELMPSQDQSRLNVRLTSDAGASLAASKPILEKAEQIVMAHPEIDRALTTLSAGSGQMTLMLVPPKQRKMKAMELGATLRKELSGIAGLRVSIQDPSIQSFGVGGGGGGGASPISFTLRGADWDTLAAEAVKFKDNLGTTGVVADVTTDYQVGAPEIALEPDRRRASELGVTMADLGNVVSAMVGGNTVGKFAVDGRRIDIRAQLLKDQRSRPEDLSALLIRTQKGDLVPLSMLVTQNERAVLASISRVNRERAITISANVAPGHSQQEGMNVVEEMSKDLPVGYRVVFSGASTQLTDTLSSLGFALLVGIMVAYMVLASQFASFLHPATVLTILPFALSGAAFSLWLSGKSLNMFSMIGVLLLMGIVKKNSIMIVEYSNQLREHAAAAHDESHGQTPELTALEAVRQAGPLRLRPILMTSVATGAAAVPSALGLGAGAETRGPMAVAVIGGLVVSTLLCLVVVPAFYVMTDRWKQRLFKGKRPLPYVPHDAAARPGMG